MRRIDLKRTYYFNAVVREGWLGSKSPFVCKRLLAEHHDLLAPQFVGQGRATRIMLEGANIASFAKARL